MDYTFGLEKKIQELSQKLLKNNYENLPEKEKKVVTHIAKGIHISRNKNLEFEKKLTFGQKIADKITTFGGSWTFILLFLGIILVWISINIYLLTQGKSFDPYPFILLNLVLSMLAALQAPIIMMSQNRQASKDREDAASDYEVNLKAELEIRRLHNKIDQLTTLLQEKDQARATLQDSTLVK